MHIGISMKVNQKIMEFVMDLARSTSSTVRNSSECSHRTRRTAKGHTTVYEKRY